jgi:lipopolysaccharide/colanic/teichoic acid biosynthesis glycosyltransferase
MKRVFDIIVSFMGLFILLPLFFISAILIKILMPGPVIFKQTRIGRNGQYFTLFKFRSMLLANKNYGHDFEPGEKSRITRLGKFLRKTKLDEIPQLINVIKGDMSIVGPRPEVKEWTEFYPDKWCIVHSLRPGITDYASIHFRNEEQILAASNNPVETYKKEILPRKLELNIEYIKNQCFTEDLKIIFKTIYTVIFK